MCKVSSTVFQCLRTPLANEDEAREVRHVNVRSEKGVVERGREGENVYGPFYEKECAKSVLQCFSV